MFLPLSESEVDMNPALRAAIYGVVMIYFFVGVAIIADKFVASIEYITARWKKVDKGGKARTVKVWNETVATLTLMALGSSAPEIFLAVIDVPKKEFHAAQLGPSTIVGSASFNLLVIVAVCIWVIPSDEVRKIKELPAFYITAVFSLGAYMWATFILTVNSKDEVEPWEAVVTFLYFPLLVWVSYKSDVGAFDGILVRLGRIRPEMVARVSATMHGKRSSLRNSLNLDDRKIAESGVAEVLVDFAGETMAVDLGEQDQTVRIPVVVTGRHGSTTGGRSATTATTASAREARDLSRVLVKYASSSFTAVPGVEYEPLDGFLVFEEGENEKAIELTVKKWPGNKLQSELLVILEDAEGADFPPESDGGDQCSILTVTLKADAGRPVSVLSKLVDVDGVHRGVADWKEQFSSAFYVGGSKEDHAEASSADMVQHVLALPWQLLFATVPPPSFFGGWLCFFGSLVGIGLLTSFVSDLAELFGCVLDLGDVVTAITFVALGTSMPDLFASLSAAKEDETADKSVVNVTGSNSVNVFLGLGVPWTICAIYWTCKERTADWAACYPDVAAKLDEDGHARSMVFVVEAGFVGFSVLSFCCCCLAALAVIVFRRRWLRCELGGPFVPKVASASLLVFLWMAWIAVVVWRVMRFPDFSTLEEGIVAVCFLSVVVGGLLVTLGVLHAHRVPPEVPEPNQRFSRCSIVSETGRPTDEGPPRADTDVLQETVVAA